MTTTRSQSDTTDHRKRDAAKSSAAKPRTLSPVLAAAAELLDEKGFEGLSTTAIAHRAKVSTATIYRDYPDKLAILRALVQEVTLLRHDLIVAAFAPIVDAPDWRKPLSDAIKTAYRLRMHSPGGHSTRRALQMSPELWLWDQKHNEELAEIGAKMLRKRKPSITPTIARRVMLTVLTTSTGLLDMACLVPRRGTSIIDESVVMMEAYLAKYLD